MQHRQDRPEARPAPGQRKWVAKLSPATSGGSKAREDPVPTTAASGFDCLARLKSSNRAAMEAGKTAGRTRLFASKKVGLHTQEEEVVEEDGDGKGLEAGKYEVEDIEVEDEMVVREEVLNKSLSSPTETEDDSGIFTSAHSKYSLDSLGEESRGAGYNSRLLAAGPPPVKLSQSLPPEYGWSADVR